MAESGAADRVARLVLAAVVVAAAFYLNFRFVLVHFSNGGYLLDSGWFAWIIAAGDPWLTNPKAISGLSYFNYHLTPYLSVLSLVFRGLGVDRFLALALHQGAMFALLAASLCAIVFQSWSGMRSAVLFAAVVVFMLLGDIMLQIAAYPHFEIAIPAFCLLGAALWRRGHRVAGSLAFALACLVREDGGLYAAAFLFGLAALRPLDRTLPASSEARLAAGATVVSLLMFWIKARYFPGYPTFASNFSGNGWDHVTLAFVAGRLRDFAVNPHVLTALLTALLLAVASWRYLMFPLLMAPVIVAQGLAVRDQLGHFMDYYVAPFLVIWAGLVLVAAARATQDRLRGVEPALLLVSALAGSAPVLFAVQPPAWLPVATTAVASEVVDLPRLADAAEAALSGVPGACGSSGVAALVPDSLTPEQVIRPLSDLGACRTVFLFDHDLDYDGLKPRLAGWVIGPVIEGRIERYDQRP